MTKAPKHLTKQALIGVAYDNWRSVPGASTEELKDLGYSTPESLEQDIQNSHNLARALGALTTSNVKKPEREVLCGDCNQLVAPGSSCPHMKLSTSGKINLVG